MTSTSSTTQDKSKRVTFFGTVKVIYIVPTNMLLKTELFYSSDDYQRFELDAYYDRMEQHFLEQQLIEEARRQSLCDAQVQQDLSYHGINQGDNVWSRNTSLVSSWNFGQDNNNNNNGATIMAA